MNAKRTATDVPAHQVAAGDRLDAASKIRVHAVREQNGHTVLFHRTRGSRAPGVTIYPRERVVKVWR